MSPRCRAAACAVAVIAAAVAAILAPVLRVAAGAAASGAPRLLASAAQHDLTSPRPQTASPADMVVAAVSQADAVSQANAAPVTLTIKTAPPLPGVRFTMDGSTMVTDDIGTAVITQDHNLDPHTLTLVDAKFESGDQRYTFSRWAGQRNPDQAFSPTLDGLTMRVNGTVTAAFTVERSVTPSFVDQNGQRVDPANVSSATVRSETGAIIDIAPVGKTWLESTRVNYRSNAPLEVQDVSYTWQIVVVAGAYIVDGGRQSFTPAKTPEVTVQGEFHDLTITGYDALLGFGTGAAATITFPDGTVQTVPMDSAHAAVFAHLPRGTYQAVVSAGSSIVASQQIRLSRDSILSVPVISLLDMAILLGSMTLAAVALMLIGRKSVRRRVLAPFRPERPSKVGVERGRSP